MANRKLFVGNYRFDASERTVFVKGNINAEKFLLITNVNVNTLIYNFADPTIGYAGKFYNQETDETEFTLVADTTAMNDSDILQIFIATDYEEITPAEDILDPVGKMRVSNPENLIDTDFEYGLQGTKWETLQTVNNIPTIYSNSGDVPIDGITSVDAINGSKNIKVSTSIQHGLNIGDPISVQGVSQYQAEGYFIVTAVPDPTEFFFELDVPANFSGDISGSYTTIIPGKFYEGSTLPVSTADGATTDGGSPSLISVETGNTHGIIAGSKVYLRNTVGPKTLEIADSTITAPDGRPYVDTVATFSNINSIDMSVDTGRGSYRQRSATTYDWESTYTKYIVPSEWDATTDQITWTGHNLRDKYALLFNTPYYGLSDGGAADGSVYYVQVIDADTIKLHNNTTLTSAVNLTTLSNTYGMCRLGLVYKIEGTNGTMRKTAFYNSTQASASATSGYFGSSSTSTRTHTLNLSQLFGGSPTSVSISEIRMGGDVNSSGEYVTISIAGVSQQIYAPGNQGPSYSYTRNRSGGTTAFDNLDISSAITTNGNGDKVITFTSSCASSVGSFVYGNDRYRFVLVLNNTTPTGSYTEAEKSISGGDLADSQYGLGGSQPGAAIAFQGRTSGSYTSSSDAYSYLANQRNNGRYGVLGVKYNQIITVTPNLNDGSFNIDYSDSNTNYSTGTEFFYVFAQPIPSDRNTIYIPNHGIETGENVNITINATDYANGQRFAFANSAGSVTDMVDNFTATVSVVNRDVIRLTTDVSPNTDDIAKIPVNFDVTYVTQNPLYNSVYINNHKVTSRVDAVYTNVTGTAIPPLTNGQSVKLDRVNDSRINIGSGVTSNSGTVQVVVERSNNSTLTDLFVDLESVLGFVPTTASISQIEFRGDFSANSEYVTLTFSDNDAYIIGRNDDNGDTAVYTTSTTFNSKDISGILVNEGGVVGFKATFAPQSQVNFGPGGGPWWGLRFTINASSQGLLLTGPGSGAHRFDVSNLVGAYDGVFTMTNIPTPSSFEMQSDFQIPIRTYDFTNTNIDDALNTVTFATDHNLITGEKITYNENGNTSILPTGVTDLFVIVVDSVTIKLASSTLDSLNDISINITPQTGTHNFTTNNVIKNINGTGSVNLVQGSKSITGANTSFLSNFKRFDKIYVNNGTFVEEFTVDTVTTAEKMTVFETSANSVTSSDYYYATQISLRPDGFGLHKPFDGGVDITAGTSPKSRIARQTRKYFRYQSGKGIQTSFAINFNPPRIVSELIKAIGDTATVKTQEQHNLKVGDFITVSGAEVATGLNTYNGTYAVSTVPDNFTFTYTMSGTPTDVKASGFPRYVRAGWTDSYVRAGMFDDQNGFFFEYDGQDLYAVRRSSTQQLAGFVNVTRGSQIVTGLSTSFTTQIKPGNKVVIRGQTYEVTEVSSDIRMVVQPAYRGVDAVNVKATLTVDTRTPQHQWNIDPADGTGFTGFILDTTKIQMGYMDYSWYGAGKIRYGFKDRVGHVRYFHEYIHNNKLDESYFRSGNLPARYEIENGPTATTSPTLFHFGTSIIMDGTFDDDKAYQFTGQSRPFAFTNGASSTFTSTGASTFEQITLDGNRVYVYAIPVAQSDAEKAISGSLVAETTGTDLPAGSFVTQVKIDGASSVIYTSFPGTSGDPTGGSDYPAIISGTSFTLGETEAVDLTRPLPLISVRLAPSVDSGLTGALGEREIINRMQLRLQQASVTANQDIELFLIQNALPSEISFQDAQSPSLSEIIKHSSGDFLQNGTTIYSTKSSAGSISVDLTDLLEIGNSILGGDGIFPAGPDLLTLAVQPQTTTGVSGTTPFTVSGKVSWSESQA